jgi:two-component system, cell cycle response regulator
MRTEGRALQNRELSADHAAISPQQLETTDRCRVLVVDDDFLVRSQLVALLRMDNYEVYAAGSGREAVELLQGTPCDILLTDWQMSDMDGLSLCRQVREKPDEAYVYIMMLTVRGKQLDMLAGLAAGVDDYVIKGASWEEILARIAVGRRITQREPSVPNTGADPVSCAYNRHYVMQHLSRELESARCFDQPLALLACALDGFREINQRLDWGTGAEILRGFVSGVLGSIREQSDWMARIDVDRFLLVLPQTGLTGGRCVADRLQRILKDQPPLTYTGPVALTMSIGVTALESSYELISIPMLEFLRAADRCLHTSKGLGSGHITAEPAIQVRALSAGGQQGPRNDIN